MEGKKDVIFRLLGGIITLLLYTLGLIFHMICSMLIFYQKIHVKISLIFIITSVIEIIVLIAFVTISIAYGCKEEMTEDLLSYDDRNEIIQTV